jgi:hypothetical protein
MSINYSDLYLVNNTDGKYLRCDTTKVASGNAGGRLFSVLPTTPAVLANGIFGFMGEYTDLEIRELLTPTSDLVKAKLPVIVHNPEINYWQISQVQSAIGMYRNRSGQVLRAFPLQELDEVSLSSDYFDLTGKSGSTPAVAVGDIFTLQANLVAGTQLKYASSAPASTDAKFYFKVTKVYNSYIPSFLGGNGSYFPNAYKMIDIELKLA